MTLQKKLKELKELGVQTLESITRMAELVVDIIDNHEQKLVAIHKATELDLGVLTHLENIGRKKIIPELVVAGNFPAAVELKKLPYSEQRRLYNGSVDVLERREGKKSKPVKVRDLIRSQVLMVFDGEGGIRDLAGQRTYIDGKRHLNPAPNTKEKLEIINKPEQVLGRVKGLKRHLKVTQGCKISWDIILDAMPHEIQEKVMSK